MSTKLVELREAMQDKLLKIKDLHGKETRTDDDDKQIDILLLEVNDLGPRIERETSAARALESITTYQPESRGPASAAVPSDGRNAGIDPKTGKPYDRRGIGRIVGTSQALTDYRLNPRGKSAPIELDSFFPEHRMRALIDHHDDLTAEELRTLIYGTALAADMVRPQVLGGIYRPTEPITGIRDVLLNGTTQSDAITFIRELLFTNAAVEVAEATDLTTTGAKPESALTFEQVTMPVQTVAHWIPITRQTLDDVSQMRTYVEGRLLDGLNRRINGQILNGNGTAPNLRGILNTSGIQALTSAGEFTTTAVLGPAANANLNRIRRGKRKVRVTGGASPNFVVFSPTDLEFAETVAQSTGGYILGDPNSGSSVQRLWGLQVVEDENMAAGTALVGDGRMAAVWDRMDAQVFVADQHSDFFIRNIFVLLAESRLALTVFRPPAFATVQLATWV